MTNQLTTFAFTPGLALRTVMREGAPWFVAADVCAALGLTNTSKALIEIAPEDKHNQSLGLPGRAPLLVNESGLYALILKSRKTEAKVFQKWVTSVVLPAIRKDGAYVVGEEKAATGEMSIEEMTLKVMAAMTAKVTRLTSEKAALEVQVAQAAPAVAFVKGFVAP